MNAFVTALQFNTGRAATKSEIRLLDRLDLVSVTHQDPDLILCAFRLLSASEPHRIPNLMASLSEGRVTDVVNHLAAYYTPERVQAHHKRIGTTLRSC
jgi:hypothetical protein